MKPVLFVFKDSPDEGHGLARDMRVRWALEEIRQPYDVRFVTFDEMEEPAYLRLHPFGQIPVYQEGDLTLFESGAIVFHVAERSPDLLPTDQRARARAIAWMFSALNSVEPPIVELETAGYLEVDKAWYSDRLPIMQGKIREVLSDLSRALAGGDWLEGDFTAADILMVTVLRRLEGAGLLEDYPSLMAYVARGESRPAYRRAFADQLKVFEDRRDA